MRKRILVIAVFILLSLLGVGGCRNAGRYLVKEDIPGRADAIVMLQGSVADRVLECVDLMEEAALADRLIMVEEGMDAFDLLVERGVEVMHKTHMLEGMFLQLGIPADKITILPGGAVSTLEEARYIRNWLAEHPEINSIILVSSPSHMRRASAIFRVAFRALDRPVEVFCSPSSYSNFHPDTWWRRKEDIQRVLSEYVKIGAFHLIERRHLKE